MNCQLFSDCDNIGCFDVCENFLEMEQDKAMIIFRFEEYADSELRRSQLVVHWRLLPVGSVRFSYTVYLIGSEYRWGGELIKQHIFYEAEPAR